MRRITDYTEDGPLPVKFSAGYSNQGTWICQVYRVGQHVFWDGIFKRDAGAFTANTNYDAVFTVPEGFRPIQTVYSDPVSGATAANLGMFIIGTDGVANFRMSGGSGINYMSINGVGYPSPITP